MLLEYNWNSGIVLGLETDTIYLVENDEDEPNYDEPPNIVIYLHLGIISLALIY
tara:strand:- start:143 stop:304 length:162 start_codon:yes stop_codon:yes gene_type:complete